MMNPVYSNGFALSVHFSFPRLTHGHTRIFLNSFISTVVISPNQTHPGFCLRDK